MKIILKLYTLFACISATGFLCAADNGTTERIALLVESKTHSIIVQTKTNICVSSSENFTTSSSTTSITKTSHISSTVSLEGTTHYKGYACNWRTDKWPINNENAVKTLHNSLDWSGAFLHECLYELEDVKKRAELKNKHVPFVLGGILCDPTQFSYFYTEIVRKEFTPCLKAVSPIFQKKLYNILFTHIEAEFVRKSQKKYQQCLAQRQKN